MKKTKRKNTARSETVAKSPPHASAWMGADGIHFVAPGAPPSPAQLDEMTKSYQEGIRNSPIWDEMVRKFGKEKAEALLSQCRAKLS